MKISALCLLLVTLFITTNTFAKDSKQAKVNQKVHRFNRKLRFYKGSEAFLIRASALNESIKKVSKTIQKAEQAGDIKTVNKWKKIAAKRKKWFKDYQNYWSSKYENNFGKMTLKEAIAWYELLKRLNTFQKGIDSVNPPKEDSKESISKSLRKRFPVFQTAIDAGEEIIEFDAQGVSGL